MKHIARKKIAALSVVLFLAGGLAFGQAGRGVGRIGGVVYDLEDKPIEGVKPGLEVVTKLAKEKIDKNKATVEGRKTFGVNKALRDPYA